MPPIPYDIYVVGTGMVGYRQLTREAEAALRKSERVYLVHYQTLVREYIEDELGTEVVALTEEYTVGENRANTYERMADRVLEGAAAADGPVSFALYGHPMVFVSPARWVREDGRERGFEVKVVPGVSSMDCLYADIGLDPAEHGLQMFEATDLLVREFELNPRVPAMVWQIGTVGTVLYSGADSSPERFTPLREYLQRFYPEDHTAYLLRTATYPITESEQIAFDLDEFEAIHDRVNAVQTLYLPPVEDKGVANEAMLDRLTSEEHLETITAAGTEL
ncbi:MAG: SAM-dependent methyltransferase [Halobacteriales archaeon]